MFALDLLIVAAVASLFLIAASSIPPRPQMRIPHRDYGLAPERSRQTIAFLRRKLPFSGTASLFPATTVMQLGIQADFEDSPRISNSVYRVLLAFFLYLDVWFIHPTTRFRRTPGLGVES